MVSMRPRTLWSMSSPTLGPEVRSRCAQGSALPWLLRVHMAHALRRRNPPLCVFLWGPGDLTYDEVQVEGPEIMAPFGEIIREDRMATILRASKLEQLWTRLTGDFEVMELCEFSFSEEVSL